MPSAEVKQTYHVHGDNSDPGSYRGKAEDQVLWLSLAFVAIAACCSSHLRPKSVREAGSDVMNIFCLELPFCRAFPNGTWMSKIIWFMGRPDAQGPHTQTMLDSLEGSARKISKLPEALRESGKNSGRTGKESLLLSLCSWHVDPSHCIGLSLGSLCCFLSSLPNGSGSDGVQRFFYIFNVFSFAGSSLGWDISFSLSNWMLALLAYCKKLYLFTSSRHLEKGPMVAKGIFTRSWPLWFSQGPVLCLQALTVPLEREILSHKDGISVPWRNLVSTQTVSIRAPPPCRHWWLLSPAYVNSDWPAVVLQSPGCYCYFT